MRQARRCVSCGAPSFQSSPAYWPPAAPIARAVRALPLLWIPRPYYIRPFLAQQRLFLPSYLSHISEHSEHNAHKESQRVAASCRACYRAAVPGLHWIPHPTVPGARSPWYRWAVTWREHRPPHHRAHNVWPIAARDRTKHRKRRSHPTKENETKFPPHERHTPPYLA